MIDSHEKIAALLRGRITTWHAGRVTADQLRAYLETVKWACLIEEGKYRCGESMPGTSYDGEDHCWIRSSSRWGDWFIRVISDHWSNALRYHHEAIESIAAIEGRGELAVWLDVVGIDDRQSG